MTELPTRLGIISIDHVGIAVADLDEAIAHYTGVLRGRRPMAGRGHTACETLSLL